MRSILGRYFVFVCLCIVQLNAEECRTPNNEEAQCISLYVCPVLLEALANHSKGAVDFVRQSYCGVWDNESEPKVCCGSKSGFEIKTGNSTSNVKNLLSVSYYCGYQHTDDYVYTGNETSIDEIPWLAIFIYKPDQDSDEEILSKRRFVQYGCSGTLINGRYVISAARCLRVQGASVVAARLGIYKIGQEKFCTKYQGLEYCSEAVDMAFEQTIIHPQYNRRTGVNDIALMRFNRTVPFSDFIRPICLPTPDSQHAKPGEILLTTGFGLLSRGTNQTITKKKIFTELITDDECKQHLEKYNGISRNVINTVICTRDLLNNTVFSCGGDFGAPLMISRRKRWYMEGFSILGTGVCGSENPVVYVKVVNYLNWIENNIEPWPEEQVFNR